MNRDAIIALLKEVEAVLANRKDSCFTENGDDGSDLSEAIGIIHSLTSLLK